MIKIIIESGVFVYNLSDGMKAKIMSDLTMTNEKYQEAMNNNRYMSADMQPEYIFYKKPTKEDKNPDENVIMVPRGYIYPLLKYIRYCKVPYTLENCTLSMDGINLKFIGKPRPYQSKAIADIKRYPVGVLEAATGSGKTFMGTAMIVERNQPTLVLVHTKELLHQWQDSVKKFIGYDAGLIGDGKFEIKKISIGIINTVRNKAEKLGTQFGHIIIDEVHRCPSTTWSDTLAHFQAKYRLGLSATPYRNDGLGKAIYIFIGPNIHTVNKKDLQDIGAVLKPIVFRVGTNFFLGNTDTQNKIPYPTKLKKLTENVQRNKGICQLIRKDLKTFNAPILIVSDRVTHCYALQKMLATGGIRSEVLSGKTKAKDRTEIVSRIKANKVKVIFATISLIGEGFDAPGLHALVLATPIKFKGRVVQVCGRVLRPEKGKEPRIYDMRDTLVNDFKYQGYSRDTTYLKEGWGNDI